MGEEANVVFWNRDGKTISRKECNELQIMGQVPKGSGCPAVWDGELCWPSTPPGIIAQHCPGMAPSAHSQAMAQCLINGTWIRLARQQNETFSNITKCFQEGTDSTDSRIPIIYDFWVPVVRKVSQVGYSCSLITLLLAFFVLFSSKKLRCPRNNLHLHLFASFILRATMCLLKGALFRDGLGMPGDFQMVNGDLVKGRVNWECKLVTSIWQYAITANYSWILAEGLYLHNLIFMALFTDSSSIAPYVALGWGLPAAVVVTWIVGRLMYDDVFCWNMHDNSNVQYLIKIPTIVTVLLSFGLFINIARVLLSKMLASVQVQRRELQYRRWARSTMVLVPLFGTHYALLLIFTVSGNDVVQVVWLLLDQTFASFQGALVALLYCLMTQEVRIELRRRWASVVTSIAAGRCGKKWCCCHKKSEARFLSSFRGGSLLHSGHGNNTGVVACQVRELDISGRLDGTGSTEVNPAAPGVPGERPVGPQGPDQNGGHAHAQSWV